jgi:hypothetical protein
MRCTRCFEEQVLRKRPYIDPIPCLSVVTSPLRRVEQGDGRVRHWGRVIDSRDGKPRILRVVTLDDGQTIHNAFFDGNFPENGT